MAQVERTVLVVDVGSLALAEGTIRVEGIRTAWDSHRVGSPESPADQSADSEVWDIGMVENSVVD